MHDSTIELAKVGKLLYTVDDGKTTQWARKSLDEIDLNSGLVEGKFKAIEIPSGN